MTTPVAVSINAQLATGAGLPNGFVRFTLTRLDRDGAVKVPTAIDVPLDGAGLATGSFWPNVSGSEGSQYKVEFFDSASVRRAKALATIPDSACNLHDVLTLAAPAVVDDAEAAALAAQGYAADAGAVLTDPAFVAVNADLPNINTVAGHVANIDTLAPHVANIDTLAPHVANIDALAADVASIDTVAGDKTQIDAVAGSIADVQIAAANIAAIVAAPAAAASALAIYADTAAMQAALAQAQTLFNRIYLGGF